METRQPKQLHDPVSFSVCLRYKGQIDGVNDILIAATNGLKGMPEALVVVFPATTLQTCIAHLIQSSLDCASWKDRKLLAPMIRSIYTAPRAAAAQAELEAFTGVVPFPWTVSGLNLKPFR